MITLTLTMGRRPNLLAQTLESLLSKIEFSEIIAINDFRDEETNSAFKKLCPEGKLIVPPQQLGHHKAIDLMYRNVRTPFIFHCEDDWLFDTTPDLDEARDLLSRQPDISAVCFRKIEDFNLTAEELGRVQSRRTGDTSYRRLDGIHDQWHGYTFNPHLISIESIRLINRFADFKKERHVSRHLRALGKHVAYIQPGTCHHIGNDSSVSNPAQHRKSTFWGFTRIFKKHQSPRQ